MQPDDFEFLTNWNAPAHVRRSNGYTMADRLLPNINRLRTDGLTMERAYTASPVCGPSRFSTLTGRYASRSAYGREEAGNRADFTFVDIPESKMLDVDGVNDCTDTSIPVLMQRNGYKTGFMGKWHVGLSANNRNGLRNYDAQREAIQNCGFDVAEAISWDNIAEGDGYLHNLEHLADEALKFIDDAVDANQEFYMYFNPTAPHANGNVLESLTEFTCRDAPEGRLAREPVIPGMTQGVGCEAYRQTILDRADGDTSNQMLGNIWVDDTVGALLQKLEDVGQLDNTFFLFQLDHGQEGKGTLYEPGVRIAQFIHYPDEIRRGSTFSGLVSTIDIGPTVADYAGITTRSRGWYDMDGESWKSRFERNNPGDRCVVSELEEDRTVVCECEKVLQINTSNSNTQSRSRRFGTAREGNLQLCDNRGNYITSPASTPEANNAANSAGYNQLDTILDCHNDATHPNQTPRYGACDYSI